jgi:hypothetical protein
LGAKKEIHLGFVLIVQREGKQSKKDGCIQRPLKQLEKLFHEWPQAALSF